MDPESLMQKGADALPPSSRNLYEMTKYKMLLSILFIASAFVFLGFTSTAGGRSSAYRYSISFLVISFNHDCVFILTRKIKLSIREER